MADALGQVDDVGTIQPTAGTSPATPTTGGSGQPSAIAGSIVANPNLAPEKIAEAVEMLLELAVELECIRGTTVDDDGGIDAAAYADLFELEHVGPKLAAVVEALLGIKSRYDERVMEFRLIRLAREIAKSIPAKKALPKNAGEEILDMARRRGLELSPDQLQAVLDAAERQPKSELGRDARIARALGYRALEKRAFEYVTSHLDDKGDTPDDRQKLMQSRTPGEVKYARQLDIAFYERANASEWLKYVLPVLGRHLLSSTKPVYEAWNRLLKEDWERRCQLKRRDKE
jgi:hypothetical protein